MAEYMGEVVKSPEYRFDFSRRDVDLLVSILYDLTSGDAFLDYGEDGRYKPNPKTLEELKNIFTALNSVGMSAENDFLSNFDEV